MALEAARAYAGTFLSRSIFLAAKLDKKIVGFAKMVMNEAEDYACIIHFTALNSHRDKSVNNALIAGAVRACAVRGLRQLAYSNFSYGNKRCDSLAEFKLHNGFERVEVPRFYVSMTLRGRIAFSLGLHHSLIERIPEFLAAPARDFRAHWYSRNVG